MGERYRVWIERDHHPSWDVAYAEQIAVDILIGHHGAIEIESAEVVELAFTIIDGKPVEKVQHIDPVMRDEVILTEQERWDVESMVSEVLHGGGSEPGVTRLEEVEVAPGDVRLMEVSHG